MPINSSLNKDLLQEVDLLDAPGGERVRAHFDGLFEGGRVRWHATLYTPTAWAAEFGGGTPDQNIIHIDKRAGATIPIRLCLKVARIERPTLRKAVMMVRQYKRLRRGRHLYG